MQLKVHEDSEKKGNKRKYGPCTVHADKGLIKISLLKPFFQKRKHRKKLSFDTNSDFLSSIFLQPNAVDL